jgi:hypothetical protein
MLWEILVPTVVGDCPVKVRHHREWDRQVRRISGGLTILKPAIGQWMGPEGELFLERMIPVRIACTEAEIEKIIRITLNHYHQQAVIAYLVSERVIIRYANAESENDDVCKNPPHGPRD